MINVLTDSLEELLEVTQASRETINAEEKDPDLEGKLCLFLDLIDEIISRLVGIVETEAASRCEILPQAK